MELPPALILLKLPKSDALEVIRYSGLVELEKPLSVGEARALWREFPGLSIIDYRQEEGYITPIEVVGEDPVFISRIRSDKSIKNGLLFWLVSDNLRKGAALNAVQIAETIVRNYLEPQRLGGMN